ncbi:MAG: type I secretion target repeat-containing protein, partial [Planctomycetota bacterium]
QFTDTTLSFAQTSSIVSGTTASETIGGTTDAEQINGLDGFDWIIPDRGNDTVNGGADRDMVSYSDLMDVPGRGTNFLLDLDLGAGRAEIFGGEVDILTSIERATGSIYADVMRGTDGNDELRGIGDYDWFIATEGNDTLNGGNGLDMVTFLEAGPSGAPVVEDIFSTDGVPPMGNDVGGVLLDLADGSNNTGLAEGLTLISVERVTGSSHQDVFFGDDQQNDFRGLGGYDWFVGSTGGRERYFGGDGLDTVTYYQSTSGVIASLRNGAGEFGGQETGFGSAGDAIRDLYFEIENLVGTNFDDRLEGNRERNQLSGLDGDDYLLGYGGIDYLKGGRGNDTLDGGAGSDFALFDGNRADYTLTRTSSTEVMVVGADGSDSLINVEYFQFDDEAANIWDLNIV